MNCGLYDAGGWNPPYVTLADIKTVDLSEAVTKDDSPFKQCTAYIDKFVYYAKQNNCACCSSSQVHLHLAYGTVLDDSATDHFGVDRNAGKLV